MRRFNVWVLAAVLAFGYAVVIRLLRARQWPSS